MSPRRGLTSIALAVFAAPALAQDEAVIEALERRTAEIAREVAPSVVAVTAVTAPPAVPRLVLPGLRMAPVRAESERLDASGFVVDDSGAVATTGGIVRGPARYELRFADGTVREARLIGTDEPFRVAILQSSGAGGTAVRPLFAGDDFDPSARRIGWLVSAAAGAPDLQLTTARTAFCAESAYDRWLTAGIALRAGSAGGPLVGRDGRVLGMAVGGAVERAPLAGAPSGIATAPGIRSTLFVRAEDVFAAAREILRFGEVRRARVGVLLEEDGSRVQDVIPGSPAERAGLRDGDVVLSVAGAPVRNATDITRAILRNRVGDVVPVETRRNGETLRATLTLDTVSMPAPPSDPPLPGTTLELGPAVAGEGERPRKLVRVVEVEDGGAAALAGLRADDVLVSVDGVDALRFLSRCWLRPQATPPSTLVVRRGEDELTLTLARR